MAYNPKYNEHQYKYRTEKYKRIGVEFERSYYDETLKPAADNLGLKVNAFVKLAIREKIEGDPAIPKGLQIPQEDLDVYAQAADERGMTLEEMILEALKVFIKEY